MKRRLLALSVVLLLALAPIVALAQAVFTAPNGAGVPTTAPLGPIYPVSLSPPAIVAANNSWTSSCVATGGFTFIGVNATLSQPGSITVNRFADPNCAYATGISYVQALQASVPGWIEVDDGARFQSFEVVIGNGSGSTANLSGVYVTEAFP